MEEYLLNLIILIILSLSVPLLFSQIIKTFINSIIAKKLVFKTLWQDGDFPSSHTALVVNFNIIYWYTLLTTDFLKDNTHLLFIALLSGGFLLLWTFIEIRDAFGLRLRVQEQANAIDGVLDLFEDIIEDDEKIKKIENYKKHLKLKAGHKVFEVIHGAILGYSTSLLILCYIEFNHTFLLFSLTLIFYLLLIGIAYKKKQN